MNANIRKWLSLLISIILFYVIHEGAHLVVALILGTFEKVRFLGLGVQVVADFASMSNNQLMIFGIVGFIASLTAAYLLVWQRKAILSSNNKLVRAIAYYSTIIFLFTDPIYLSVVYRFVGGGDMNSVLLTGIPEMLAAGIFLIIAAVNLALFIKLVYPAYKKRFQEDQ